MMFFGTIEAAGRVPAGAVEQQDGVSALGDGAGDLVEVELHGLGVGVGQGERGAGAARRADGAEQVGALVTLVGRLARPRAAPRPLPHEAVLLADAGLVLEPDLDRLAFGDVGQMRLQRGGEVLWDGPPLLLRRRYAAGADLEGEERTDDDRGAWDRPGQEQLQRRGSGRHRSRGPAAAPALATASSGLRRELPACVVAMEACCGAHHLGRVLREQGHEVRLMSPEYVQPYVKAQKNDERDAEAIAEAATRPTMRFVELKSEAQLDTADPAPGPVPAGRPAHGADQPAPRRAPGARHRRAPRDGASSRSTSSRCSDDGAEPPATLSPRTRLLIEDMRAEWGELDRRIAALDDEFVARAREDEAARRLATIPGIGAAQRDGAGRRDRHGRDLPPGARPRRLARAGAAAGDDGRQAAAARHHQAGQHLPAQAPDPRRASGPAVALGERDAARRVAARPPRTGPQEQGRRGAGRQAGPDRLGGAALGRELREGSRRPATA